MAAPLKRDELDALAEHYRLTPDGVDAMLDISGARPTRSDTLRFLATTLRYAGILSLGSALVFFVAANWSRLQVYGRFGLIELALVGLAALAFYKPPPRILGRAALFLAFIATGALLALYGQTYQTGADVYELFLGWALLGLPLVFVGQWGATSAAWVVVLNTSLLLYCGWNPRGGWLFVIFGGSRLTEALPVLAAAALDLGLWYAAERVRPLAVPEWVRRLLLTCGFLFVTWAGVFGVLERDAFALGVALLLMALVAAHALRERRDIYPLALVVGCGVIIVSCAIARVARRSDELVFFLLAAWLIAASTLGGRWLMKLMRRWRAAEAA